MPAKKKTRTKKSASKSSKSKSANRRSKARRASTRKSAKAKKTKAARKAAKSQNREANESAAQQRPLRSQQPEAAQTRTKTAGAQDARARRRAAGKGKRPEYAVAAQRGGGALPGEQAGDLQGLRRRQGADSESVDELVEEGNAYEAGIIEGVEEADAEIEREVHTREVPEDDVPGEYLNRDK